MALQDSNSNAQAVSSQAAAKPTIQQQPTGNVSFFGRPPMERNPGGEFSTSLNAKFAEILKTSANTLDYDVSIIPIDNTSADSTLMFSVMVIAATHKAYRDVTAYHTLILEATADRIPAKFETQAGQQQIEILRLTSDSYDNVMRQVVKTRVLSVYPQNRLLDADGTVVPRTFNLQDQAVVHSLLANSLTACYSEILISHPDFNDFSVTNSGNGTTMTIQHRFEREQISDETSNPIRRDMVVAFSTQQNQNNQNASLNAGQRVREISTVSGFIDICYAPLKPPANIFSAPPQFQDPQALVTYTGRLVITDINTRNLTTPATNLLAIATAMTVRDNNAWYGTFINNGGKKNDIHDIGAIGFEVPIGQARGLPAGTRIDTKRSDWGPQELAALMAMTFQQGLLVSMDVPDCGPQTWYTSIFAAASMGNSSAYESLYNAAQTLTNGNFGNLFQKGQPMFSEPGQRFHMGHYTDENGVKRDIRDIDYLAILYYAGEKSIQTVTEWSNTWNASNISNNERLAIRKRILMTVAPNVEFTAFGTRLTFHKDFLSALAQSITAAGLRTTIRDGFNTQDFLNQRGVASLGNGLLVNGNTPFIQGFSMGGNNQSNNFMTTRWN